MAQNSDITSTEKLLKVIRDKKEGVTAPPAAPAPESPKPKPGPVKPPLKFKTVRQKGATVGIDIGHDHLRLVKATESGGRWRMVARRRLPLPARVSRDMPEFASFLRTSLAAFCGSPDQADLWCIMSAAQVELRHLRIPKVPKKQIPNAVFWTAKKEMAFSEKDSLLDFEVQGEIVEQGVPRLSVMVYTAPQAEVDLLKNLFSRVGWPLAGVSIAPFAIQNLFRRNWIPKIQGSVASLYIGNDFSRIDIFNGGDLVLTRGIKAGANSMVEALVEGIEELKQDQEGRPFNLEQIRKVINSLSPDADPLEPSDAGYGLAKEAVFETLQPALERLVRQVERTFEYYMATPGAEAISRIFVSSATAIYQPMVAYVGAQLGVESAVLDPISAQGPPIPCPDVDDSLNITERLTFTPALGLALSDSDITPNLIFTSKDKEQAIHVSRINKGILAVFVFLALICGAILAYQGVVYMQKKENVAKLEKELAALGPTISRDQLTKMLAKIEERRTLAKVYAERYMGMVLVSELAAITPDNIRFINLKTILGSPRAQVASKAPAPKPAAGAATAAAAPAAIDEVTLEGLVIGDRKILETSLAGYVMLLEASPVFRQVTIQKNSVEPFQKGQALHFILNMRVEEQIRG